ncbi:MAG: glycosyltransferase family 4 protein [Candidatus Aminicenantes bacterium]|nr:glycosyltransferase family 4 protein [Candidatus Aminicenantes bacterium]
MRLVYVNYRPNPGVFKKIQGQASAALRLQLPVDIIVLSDDISGEYENLKIFPLHLPKNYLKYKWAVNFSRYKYISNCLDLSRYDRIILRYVGAEDFSWRFFMKKFGNKTISEHHTQRYAELKVLEKGALNFFRAFYEKKNAPRFISRTIGIIGVTEELREYYCSLSSSEKPSITIPNGIDVDRFPLTGFKPFSGRELNLIFVASTFYPWHGLSRILSGLAGYEGGVKVELYLAGKVIAPGEKDMIKRLSYKKNVKIHVLGEIFGNDIDQYFSKSHLALSSLALFRNRMREACVLKTREYVARGIPFIYAYDDPDLTGKEQFALKLENRDRPVEMESLIHFARKVSKERELSRLMRDFAGRNLSWKHKIKGMYDFAVNS